MDEVSESSVDVAVPSIEEPGDASATPEPVTSIRSPRSPHPTMPSLHRQRHSGTIIVPRDHIHAPTPDNEYPPDDARAMSPRRSSAEMDKLGNDARLSVQEHARECQQNLMEIAESIELVKISHDKLEKQNLALQDYIGGLTRSMSRNEIGAAGSKSKK